MAFECQISGRVVGINTEVEDLLLLLFVLYETVLVKTLTKMVEHVTKMVDVLLRWIEILETRLTFY